MNEKWVVGIAMVTGLGLWFNVFRSRQDPRMLRSLVSLFCLWSALIYLPATSVAPVLIKAIGTLLILLSALYLAAHLCLGVFLQFKNHKLFQKRIRLPAYLQEISKAAQQMASRKIGCLIVVERKQPVLAFTTGGLAFDAEVKAEILVSLFVTTSLVHDGAVIVRKERIQKVKTVLPLATQSSLPMNIGTRHRSAVGLTQRTDAVVIVVSEERGEISVACKGRLIKAAGEVEIDRLLDAALRGKEPGNGFLGKIRSETFRANSREKVLVG